MLSNSRHEEPAVRSYAVTHPPGRWTLPRDRGWHQLLLASRGVLTAQTPQGVWTAPPDRAVWVPAGIHHELRVAGRTAVRALYLRADRFPGVSALLRSITVSPLLRELVLEAVRRAPFDGERTSDAHLLALLLEELTRAEEAVLALPWPRRAPATGVAERLLDDPARPLDELAAQAGVSRRSLERQFACETALTPGEWQRRARFAKAVRLLAEGHPVTTVALAVGYSTPSAFSAAFRRSVGHSPTVEAQRERG